MDCARVLTPMMENESKIKLTDTQMEEDNRKLAIDKVGVKNLRFPIRILDKSNSFQDTIATVSMYVDLPHHFKGTHMSRFIEVLNSHGNTVHVENIPEILSAIQKRLQSQTAHVEMDFPFFLEKAAPVTGKTGLVDYSGRFEATAKDSETDFILEVRTNVTTLCPCSKAISAHGAHNQRGEVTVRIRSEKTIWIEDVIDITEASASSEMYSLLKRQDEKAVTERAYENPVFVEDLVRNIATRLNSIKHISWYKIEAENFESIHNHNAYASIEKA